MKSMIKQFQDWMTVITFAEAGEPEMGFCIKGEPAACEKEALQENIKVAAKSIQTGVEQEVTSPSAASVPVADKKFPKEKLVVMVVDDEPIVCKRLKPALSKFGYDVEVFEDPTKAMARFDEKVFDIVVTDLRMETLNGIEVLERVMSKSVKTKVIFITGYATVENAREALVKGAFDFIAKPFKINDLRMAITKAALSLGYMAGVAGASA